MAISSRELPTSSSSRYRTEDSSGKPVTIERLAMWQPSWVRPDLGAP
jgi:hypothetical protein